MHPDFPYHPYKGSKEDFNNAAGQLLSNFMVKYTEKARFTPDKIQELTKDSGVEDTLVFPLLQMKTMGVEQDEHVTFNMISSAPASTNLLLATAYFNLTDRYWDAVLSNDCTNRLLMAHPKAMGFYQAPGMAGMLLKFVKLIYFRDVSMNILPVSLFLGYNSKFNLHNNFGQF